MLRQMFDMESSTYTYLISSDTTEKPVAILVDPVQRCVAQYCQLLKELSITLIAVIDTHVHADHITGSGLLQDETGCKILMSDQADVVGLTTSLPHLSTLDVGDVQLVCLYTPGHTNDSCCLYNPAQNYLLTGDTLLIRGTGRTDFQSGSAQQAWDSLTQLMKLPSETRVYPGHDYKGMTWSTLKEEKQFNPRLQVSDHHHYAELMASLNLPPPKFIETAVPANRNCGRT